MALPNITGKGHLGGDPELTFTPQGHAKARFSVACTERKRTPDGGWEDGSTTWLNCTAWRQTAENVADALRKGDLVTVQGRLTQREYEGKTYYDVQVDDVTKALPRVGGQSGQKVQRQQGRQDPQDDPWATSQPANDPWATPSGHGPSDPPF